MCNGQVAANVLGYEGEVRRDFSLPLQAVIQAHLFLNEGCRSQRDQRLGAENARALRIVLHRT